ncbi:hypothetical protein [Chitinibacter tainanensis]|uniref:hypothetical protein n=1 Tax=Chitinibacter tainanensis TaxID=230667 RepID=UPI0023523DED|nr:hypothetical protein [Chitinibacter tainanensis]
MKFAVPAIDPSLAATVQTDPKQVKEWLIALPTGNVIEAGRMLLDALTVLNQVKLEPEARIQLLNQYQNSLEMLTGGFELAYASPALPMHESARTAAQLARNVWLAMATGWKIAMQDKLDEKILGLFTSHNKIPPTLIQATLYSFWRVAQVSARLYQPLPPGLWQEAHQLFRYGVEHKILDEPKNDNPKDKTSRPLATLYKQLVLLALADPHRFAGPEFDKVIEIIESYAPYAHFQPLGKLSSSAGYFLIELNSDKAPYYVGNRSLEPYLGQAVLFDTIELAKRLHKAEHSVEAKAPMAKDRSKVLMWLEILRRVIRQWSIVPHRLYQRIPTAAKVRVAFGLQRAVIRLNGGQQLTPPGRSAALGHEDLLLTEWQVVNESPGGYGILANDLPREHVLPGDLVALSVSDERNWMIASVRWLQQHPTGAMEMGLQVMSAKAQPLLMRQSTAAAQAFFPALLLPAIPALKQGPRIATPKGEYIPLRDYTVALPAGEQHVRSAKLVEQQNGYDLFEFTGELGQSA